MEENLEGNILAQKQLCKNRLEVRFFFAYQNSKVYFGAAGMREKLLLKTGLSGSSVVCVQL